MSDRAAQVGPVLESSDAAESIIAAIKKLNPVVTVEDRGSYLRVLCPQRCLVTRRAIEEELGRSFKLPGDLEHVMPSFKGTFSVSEEEALWSVGR
jgi:hypothetical protein